jgi:hypothetical protein
MGRVMRRRGFSAIALVGTASVLLALPGSALSHVERAQDPGNFAASVTGPQTITTSYCCAPQRFDYSISIQYVGPTLTGPIQITFTDQLPDQVINPGMVAPDAHLNDCTFPPIGVTAGTVSCTAHFDPTHLTNPFVISVRPTFTAGDGTSTLTLSTGESASWTTQFVYIAPPPPPPVPPPPLPGPPAAAPKTVVETFAQPGEAKPEAVRIAPSAETAQVALTWPDSNSSFDVVGIQLVPAAGKIAAAAVKLRITKVRKKRSLDVRVKNLHRGTLKFKIVAKKLGKSKRVKATIRQSKR